MAAIAGHARLVKPFLIDVSLLVALWTAPLDQAPRWRAVTTAMGRKANLKKPVRRESVGAWAIG